MFWGPDARFQAYMVDLLKLPYKGKKPSPEEKITYTAMHGVGYEFCKAAYATAGLAPYGNFDYMDHFLMHFQIIHFSKLHTTPHAPCGVR